MPFLRARWRAIDKDDMTQTSLFSARPIVSEEAIAHTIDALRGSGWMRASELSYLLIFSDRKIRAIAHASRGQILGGNRGYRLTLEASAEEVNEATGRLRAQREQEQQRILDIERVYHARKVTAA